ncbi:membrane-spanning 4-domains subfamily A member 12-like [Prionailurus viverrinus]|uniref:membrane-spanning 4-domains subfamily A member 12-like n=1 Tax=Prionailurus viverrinus TaxID=61388 RepID=UPI001FF23C3B|nr:membrane-spanning 4-domains subfamily A member 12-like [Prionailurus viverrinus]
MSSQPTNQPQTYETTLSPYPPSNTMAPGSPPPLGFTHPTKQAQSAQPPFFGSPGIITKSQQGQGNIQMVNPATGGATTNFREEAKILGAIQILIGLMHIGFRIILGLMDAIYGLVFAFLSFAFISGYAIRIRGSLGMNTVSAIFVSTGVTLLLLDAGMNGILSQDCWAICVLHLLHPSKNQPVTTVPYSHGADEAILNLDDQEGDAQDPQASIWRSGSNRGKDPTGSFELKYLKLELEEQEAESSCQPGLHDHDHDRD